ncbi:MAG: LamG domain-containing protein [Kiritimatiellae bacterium]|nr:LamG domain-containing protein [Kiritimatiellia bacterium]
MKKRFWLAVAAAIAGSGVFAALDSRSYVQEGIVAQWDAIENGARGMHNPNATGWVDLSGHNHNLNTLATGSTWNENSLVFPVGKYGMAAVFNGTTAVNIGDYASYDLAYTETSRSNSAPFIFGFGNYKGYCLYPTRNSIQTENKQGWALPQAEMTLNVPHMAYADYGTPGSTIATNLVYDGVVLTRDSNNDGWTQSTSGLGYANNNNWSFHGGLHALRLYNRSLTPAEVGLNRAIDLVRFAGKTTSEVSLPEGYSWTSTGTGVSLVDAVSFAVLEGGLVSADNAAPAASGTFTREINAQTTLKAVPSAGYTFHRWTGDTTAIAKGSTTSAEITVSTARKILLTAEFTELKPVAGDFELAAADDLIHRWSFNGNLTDSVSGRSGTSSGTIGWNDADHPTAVSLPGGARGSSGIDLGANNFPLENGPLTIELWARQDGIQNWARIFDIGLDNTCYLLMSWTQGTTFNNDRVELESVSTQTVYQDATMAPYELGTMYHISMTLTPQPNGYVKFTWAKRDVKTGDVLKSYSGQSVHQWRPLQLAPWHFWLGRSQYTADNDAQATYDEVRIWKAALTEAQLTTSAKNGPDKLPTEADTFTVAAMGAGKVRVNDGAACTTTNVTIGAEQLVALTAVPAAGAFFAGWEGDAHLLSETSLADATILVKPSVAADFTAVFDASDKVRTATWTGAAGDGDVANAANWTCRNVGGTVLDGKLPTADTVVTLAGSLAFNVPAGSSFAFKQVVFGDVTLTADCDWRGLGVLTVDSLINLNGHKLFVKGFTGKGSFTSPHAVDTSVSLPEPDGLKPCLWLDAADAATVVADADGRLATWTSKDASQVVGRAAGDARFDTLTYGRPVIDLGAVGSGRDVTYPRFTNLRTVFWVIRIVNNANNFLLGDANGGSGVYNFHRAEYLYGNSSYAKFKAVWNGLTQVAPYADYLPQSFQLISATMTQDCCSDSLSQDRNLNPRNGGRQISELVCYSTELTDAQRTQVVNYLQQKWFNTLVPAGELHLDVAEGETFTNTSMVLKGNVRLVKDGLGTYISSVPNQLNDGGLEVAAGVVKANASGNSYRHGGQDTEIIVDAGAAFDVAGCGDFAGYNFTLAGGRLANTGADVGNGTAQIRTLALAADSSAYNQDIINWGHRVAQLDLGGHVLNWEGGNNFIHNTDAQNGTIKKTDGLLTFAQTSFRGRTAGLDVSCPLVFNVNGDVGNVTLATPIGTISAAGTGVFKVFGTFKPVTTYMHNFQLQDGAVLDLTGWSVPYPITSPDTGKTLAFAANATVMVDVHGRSLVAGEKLIAWSAIPADVTFVFDPATVASTGAQTPVATAEGLFYGTPAVARVTKATWTGTANDGDLTNPANWTCTNGAGDPVEGGLPGAQTAVTIAGENLNVQFAEAFACASVTVGTGSLAGDCDWRGLGDKVCFTGTLDLKGRKFFVSTLRGNGMITDSFGYDVLDYIESTGAQMINTDIIPGSNTVVNLEFSSLGYKNDSTIFGCKTWGGNRFLFIEQSDNFRFYGAGTMVLPFTANTRYTFKVTAAHKAELYDTYDTCLSSVDIEPLNSDGTQMTLFACNGGDHQGVYRLHAMQIYAGTSLQRDFVPVRVLSTGKVCLLDRTSGILYADTRAGVQPFNAGLVKTAGRAAGELHVTVPENETMENNSVTIGGQLTFVKDGAGTFKANKTAQRYNGGTRIEEGLVIMPFSGSSSTTYDYNVGYVLGRTNSGSPIVIAANGTLESNGNYDGRSFNFVLEGGTLSNTGCSMTAGWGAYGPMTLTADSTLAFTYQTTFAGGASFGALHLDNHTLTLESNGSTFRPEDSNASNGTVRVTGGGRFEISAARDWSTVDLVTDGPVTAGAEMTFHNFVTTYTGSGNGGASTLKIAGMFAPGTDATFPTVTLLNNAVLDLSQQTTALDGRALRFAPEARVKIALGGRRPSIGEKLFTWDAIPGGVAFEWEPTTASWATQTPVLGADGLYYGGDLTSRVVNLAVWTGSASDDITDPQNWKCFNLVGTHLEGELPGEVATVRLVGAVNMQVPAGTPLRPFNVEFVNCSLAADCDWRGFDVTINGKIDLQRHKLYLSSLKGNGEITDTSVLRSEYTGVMTTTDRLIWRGVKLRDLGAIYGRNCGSYWGGASGVMLRGAIWGHIDEDTSVKVQFQQNDGTYVKTADTVFTEKDDGVYVKLENGDACRYIKNTSYAWHRFPVAGDSKQTVATSPTAAGYNVQNLTAYGQPGELHLDVPEGTIADNGSLLITGNVKFVKEGKGFFIPTKTGHTYYGGTELVEGFTRMWSTHYPIGYSNFEMVIQEGATLDIDGKATTGGRVASQATLYALKGGEVANLGGALTSGWTMMAHVRLYTNSVVGAQNNFGFVNNSYTPCYVDLSGHKLTVDLGVGSTFFIYNTEFTAGEFCVTSGGWLEVDKTSCRASDTDFDLNCAMRIKVPFAVRSYIARYNALYNDGTAAMTVSHLFKPCSDVFYGCQLLNGATLDLSGRETVWSMKSACTTGSGTVTFAAGGTFPVNAAGRWFPQHWVKVVTWETKPNATFERSLETKRAGLLMKVEDDGIYMSRQGGTIFFLR